jgi:hypothetical protein
MPLQELYLISIEFHKVAFMMYLFLTNHRRGADQ